ncbi:TrbC/VirB2 family protein [Lysinibacillus sphaericus]|uniref:TrbC/VirB2 family protein n=1 Tax=Lysinibacillus sphaericus TaxID=1421 RepID=UPI003F79D462
MQLIMKKKMYVSAFVIVLIAMLVLWFQVPFSYADTLQEKINQGSNKVVQFLKDCLKAIVVVMFAWMGYSLLFSKTVEGLADIKGRAAIVLLCFLFILGGDWIYETVNGFFS